MLRARAEGCGQRHIPVPVPRAVSEGRPSTTCSALKGERRSPLVATRNGPRLGAVRLAPGAVLGLSVRAETKRGVRRSGQQSSTAGVRDAWSFAGGTPGPCRGRGSTGTGSTRCSRWRQRCAGDRASGPSAEPLPGPVATVVRSVGLRLPSSTVLALHPPSLRHLARVLAAHAPVSQPGVTFWARSSAAATARSTSSRSRPTSVVSCAVVRRRRTDWSLREKSLP